VLHAACISHQSTTEISFSLTRRASRGLQYIANDPVLAKSSPLADFDRRLLKLIRSSFPFHGPSAALPQDQGIDITCRVAVCLSISFRCWIRARIRNRHLDLAHASNAVSFFTFNPPRPFPSPPIKACRYLSPPLYHHHDQNDLRCDGKLRFHPIPHCL
jgi:hypothetical protein